MSHNQVSSNINFARQIVPSFRLVEAQMRTVSQALKKQKAASEAALKQCCGNSHYPYRQRLTVYQQQRQLPSVYQQHTAQFNASKSFIREQLESSNQRRINL